MFVKTGRETAESSCHSVTVGTMPETIVNSASATPRPMTTCWGRMRPFINRGTYSGGLTADEPPTSAGWADSGAPRRLPVCLGVELADAGCEARQELVREPGDGV